MAAIAVLYIVINVYNYSGLVITVINNFAGFILSRVGYKDLSIYFSNKLSL